MGISGINDYSAMFQNYRTPVIPSVTVEQVREQDRLNQNAENTAQAAPITPEITPVEQPTRKDAALEDISLSFNKQDDFGYIGRDSDIRSLDVERAIDDMRKDSILQRYQYFVGSVKADNADGTVIIK